MTWPNQITVSARDKFFKATQTSTIHSSLHNYNHIKRAINNMESQFHPLLSSSHALVWSVPGPLTRQIFLQLMGEIEV